MAKQIKQSSTAYPLEFFMADTADHIAGKTGLTPTVKIGKNGGTGAAPAGAVSEIDAANLPGWYKVAGNATDSNTLGIIILHATAAGADPCDREFEVVAYDPQDAVRLGLSTLPNAAANATGGLPILTGTTLAYTVTTVTTLTGHTPQTGDAYARLGAPAGASHAADVASVFSRIGAPAGASVSADIAAMLTAINNLNNLSALANLSGPTVLEIPDAGSSDFKFTVTVKDEEGHLVNLDASPTIAVTNAAGTDRSGNLSVVSHPSTGVYTFIYNVDNTDGAEGLSFVATGAVSTSARRADFACVVTDVAQGTAIADILAKVTALHDSRLTASRAAKMDNLDAAISTRATAAQVNTELLDVIWTDATVELAVIPTATSPLGKLLQWVFHSSRHKKDQDGELQQLYKSDGTTVLAESGITDVGGVTTVGAWAAP